MIVSDHTNVTNMIPAHFSHLGLYPCSDCGLLSHNFQSILMKQSSHTASGSLTPSFQKFLKALEKKSSSCTNFFKQNTFHLTEKKICFHTNLHQEYYFIKVTCCIVLCFYDTIFTFKLSDIVCLGIHAKIVNISSRVAMSYHFYSAVAQLNTCV